MNKMHRLLLVFASLGLSATASDKSVRVFITDSESWTIAGGVGVLDGSGGGAVRGGARPQTVEVMKTFAEHKDCGGITVTIDRERADFVVLFDHEGGKGAARKDNKIAVFNSNGDMLHSGSTRLLGSAVKDACKSILESSK